MTERGGRVVEAFDELGAQRLVLSGGVETGAPLRPGEVAAEARGRDEDRGPQELQVPAGGMPAGVGGSLSRSRVAVLDTGQGRP